MNRGKLLLLASALLAPHGVCAQVQPHRAQYVLRLDAVANAPRIGTAVQDITLDCMGWRIKRDILSEIALTSSLKVSLASKLNGEESRDGKAFRYHTVQTQNGAEHDTSGKVRRSDGETLAEIQSSNGLERLTLPPPTLMPVAGIDHLITALLGREAGMPTPVFGAEGPGGAYLVDVKELGPDSLRPLPPAIKPVTIPAKMSWSIAMTFSRPHEQDQKPLFSLRGRIFDTGVLDRLTVDAGPVIVTADLEALEMHKAPACPGY